MKKINLAIVGYGGMGSWHQQYAVNSDTVNLLGVYDIRKERNEVAESRGFHAYSSFEELLADPAVDMVTVAVPNDAHEEVCIRALEAGKHVLCEKPVTLDCASLDRMYAAAKKAGRLFSVHQNRRWDADYLIIKGLVESGEIGEPIRIESRVQGSNGIPGDWRGIKKHGGGMLFDWGVHLIDQILQIYTAPVVSIDCRFDHITNDEVDDGFRLDMTFADGKTGYVEVGTFNFIALPRLYMRAMNGSALIANFNAPCKVVKCIHMEQGEVKPVITAAGLTKTMAPRDELTIDTYEVPQPPSDVHDYYRNFAAAMAGEADLIVTYEQVKRVLQVIETAFESAEKNQVIPCNI